MAKTRRVGEAKLPTYQKDRGRWREAILASVLGACQKAGVSYGPDDELEVVVLLYLMRGKRHAIHDVDNRLKDILDALQGRLGSHRASARLIENDNQVCRVVMEKQPIPKMFGGDAGGRLMIRPYTPHRWPLQRMKGSPLRKTRRGDRKPTRGTGS
jgi:Holliday junction resolvase RusA-like endonuclease